MSRTILTEVAGWTPLIDYITLNHGLTVSAVFGRMWRYCQMQDGNCWASLGRIANDLGLNRDTVRRSVQLLVKEGFLYDLDPDTLNRPHRYADTGKAHIAGRFAAQVNEDEEDSSDPENGRGNNGRGNNGRGISATSDENGRGNSASGRGETASEVAEKPRARSRNFRDKDSIKDSTLREELREAESTPEFKKEKRIWSRIKGQLEKEMPIAPYKTHVAPTRLVNVSGDLWTIAAPPLSAIWLDGRLKSTALRMLIGILNTSDVEIEFIE